MIKDTPIALYWAGEPRCTVRVDASDDRLELTDDWLFEIITKKSVHRFTILSGFRFEGSVPRVFWRVITPTDPKAWVAFAIHDFLYQLVRAKLVTREVADECLFLALKGRYNWLIVRGVYCAVRWGGGSHVKNTLTAREKYEIRNILDLENTETR